MNRILFSLSFLGSGLLTLALFPATSSAHPGGGHHTNVHHSSINKVGKNHSHKFHKKHWGGFSQKRWSPRWQCWIYWSPSDCCWYRYCAASDCFEPFDDMTDQNAHD
jgi:hypothetical protein